MSHKELFFFGITFCPLCVLHPLYCVQVPVTHSYWLNHLLINYHHYKQMNDTWVRSGKTVSRPHLKELILPAIMLKN